jgi:hypothetical protein
MSRALYFLSCFFASLTMVLVTVAFLAVPSTAFADDATDFCTPYCNDACPDPNDLSCQPTCMGACTAGYYDNADCVNWCAGTYSGAQYTDCVDGCTAVSVNCSVDGGDSNCMSGGGTPSTCEPPQEEYRNCHGSVKVCWCEWNTTKKNCYCVKRF